MTMWRTISSMPYGKKKPIKFRKLVVGDTFTFIGDEKKVLIKISSNRYKVVKGGGTKYLMRNKNSLIIKDRGSIQLTGTEMPDWRKNGILLRNV